MTTSSLGLIKVTPNNRNFCMLVASEHYDQYLNNLCENYSIELLLRHLRDNCLFIDIGAHYGYYTIAAGTRFKNCRIISFEPSPENYNILKKNIELNGLDNVKLFNLAVSDKDEIKEFIIAGHSDNCGFYEHPLSLVKEKISVETIAIDNSLEYTPNTPIIIKISVEGHELSVLDGMDKLLKDADDVELFIEFNPKMIKQSGRQPDKLIEKIVGMGFAVFFIEDEKRVTYKLDNAADWEYFFGEGNYKKGYFNILCIKKKRSLSLLIFSHSSEMAGGERSLLELTKELITEKNVLCTIVMPGNGPLKNALENVGASVISLNYSWWCDGNVLAEEEKQSLVNNSFNILNQNKETFAKINPDVILTNTLVIPWGAVVAYQLDKPHVWHVREFGELDHKLHFFLPFPKVLQLIKASNLIFTNSDSVRNYLGLNECGNALTIYNYIDISPEALQETNETHFSRQSATKLIITGSVSESKGQADAIHAVKRLIEKKYDVELVIIGSGNPGYIADLKKIVVEEGMEHSVKFEEFALNPYPAVKQADIILICSRNEAFGRVIVEGMLLKKPVIGTNSGGVPEVINEGVNGLLYDPGNSSMLADKIEYLINYPEKQKKLGENGYIFVKKSFTADRYGGEICRRLFDVKDAPSPPTSPLLAYMVTLMDQVIHSENLQLEHLKKQVVDRDSQVQVLEQLVSNRDSQIQVLEQLVSNRDSQIQVLEQLVSNRDSQIQVLEQQVSNRDSQVQVLEHQTAEMRQSILFQLTERFHGGFIERVFPINTKRRQIYNMGLQSGRVLVNNRLNSLRIETHKDNTQKEEVNETKDEGRVQNVEVKELGIDINLSKNLERSEFSKLAAKYIRGKGIQIGPRNRPMDIPNSVSITNIDASCTWCINDESSVGKNKREHSVFSSMKLYPFENKPNFDESENRQLDFCIVMDIVEQAINPEKLLNDCLSILKPGGIIYLVVSEGIYTKTDEKIDSQNNIKIKSLGNHKAKYQSREHVIEITLDRLLSKEPDLFKVIEHVENEIEGIKSCIFIIEKDHFAKKVFECLVENKTNQSNDIELDIIIPVYNAYEDLIRCLHSVLTHQEDSKIILINDKSTDPKIRDLFVKMKPFESKNLVLLENSENQGFVKTVNKGMKFSRNDVILLNSDTIVTKNWISKLRECARTDPKSATVTPFTNRGTICSIPNFCEANEIPIGFSIESFADFIEQISFKKYPEIPTAVGFCMYIKREVLDKVGYFNEEAFGKGYGEENDFSMRVIYAGYKNILCDDTFIFHKGEASFLASKAELITKNLDTISKMYPDYFPAVSRFISLNPLENLHENIQLRIKMWDASKNLVLHS